MLKGLVIVTGTGGDGPVKVIACIEDPVVIKQILDHLVNRTESLGLSAKPQDIGITGPNFSQRIGCYLARISHR